MQTDEAELIARSLSGDHLAYASLVDRYKKALYHHCFAIVRDEETAEDMAQETFITAYYHLSRYDSKYRLSTWLFTIATRKSLNHLKRSRREVHDDGRLAETLMSPHAGPETKAQHAELHALVTGLQPKYRAVISLYYWQGLDYADTAKAMRAPLGSVKVWLKRAKEQLRKELS